MIYNSYEESEQQSDMIELEDLDFDACYTYCQDNAASGSLTVLIGRFIHEKYKCFYHYTDGRVQTVCDIIRKMGFYDD